MLLAVAAVLALGTGLLLFNYLASVNKSAQGPPPRNVVVAAKPIPAHVKITADELQVVQRPVTLVEPDAAADISGVVGSITVIDIPLGGSVTSSKLAHGQVSELPVELKPGQRAISIAIDKMRGVGGLVQAGDHVDIIAVPPHNDNDEHPRAYTILRDIPVLAVGSHLAFAPVNASPGPDEGAAAQTVTLEVNAKQADQLSAADVNSQLRLALRSSRERPNDAGVEPLVLPAHLAAAQPVAAPMPVQPVAPPQAVSATPQAHPGVTVIDGDVVEH